MIRGAKFTQQRAGDVNPRAFITPDIAPHHRLRITILIIPKRFLLPSVLRTDTLNALRHAPSLLYGLVALRVWGKFYGTQCDSGFIV